MDKFLHVCQWGILKMLTLRRLLQKLHFHYGLKLQQLKRAGFLRKLSAETEKRNVELTQTIIDELGMPIQHAAAYQVDVLGIICESYADKAHQIEDKNSCVLIYDLLLIPNGELN